MLAPKLFISFSYGEPLSRLLADVVADVAERECGITTNRYRTADGFQWIHDKKTYTESSLEAAKNSLLTLSLVFETHCGHLIREDPETKTLYDVPKSMVQLEFEEAQKKPGDTAVALRVRRSHVAAWAEGSELPNDPSDGVAAEVLRSAAKGNLDKWNDLPRLAVQKWFEDEQRKRGPNTFPPGVVSQQALMPDEWCSVTRFNADREGKADNLDFDTIANLRQVVRLRLEAWKDKRPVPAELPPSGVVAQPELAAEILKGMHEPGWVCVTGGIGDGQDEAALKAANELNRDNTARRIIYVNCAEKTSEEVLELISGKVVKAEHDADKETLSNFVRRQLEAERNVLVLITPPQELISRLPHGKATVVIVTDADALPLLRMHAPSGEPGMAELSARPLTEPQSADYFRAVLREYKWPVDANPVGLECVVRQLHGWPLALKTAAEQVVWSSADGVTEPVEKVAQLLKEKGVSGLKTRSDAALSSFILAVLSEKEQRALVPLAALPTDGFGLRAAALALALGVVDTTDLLDRLTARRCLVRVKGTWRLRPEYHDHGSRQQGFGDRKAAVERALRDAILPEVERLTANDTRVLAGLMADARLAVRLAVAEMKANPQAWKKYQGGVVQLARRIGYWEPSNELAAEHAEQTDLAHDIRVNALFERGRTARFAGRWKDAEGHYRVALDVLNGLPPLGEKGSYLAAVDQSIALTGLGTALAHQNRHGEAADALNRALDLEREWKRNDRWGEAVVLHRLARSLWQLGRHDRPRARSVLAESEKAGGSGSSGNAARHKSHVNVTRAGFDADEGKWEDALAALTVAETAATQDQNAYQQAFVVWRRGGVLSRAGRLAEAREALEQADGLASALNAPVLQFNILSALADVLVRSRVTEQDVTRFAALVEGERDARRRGKLRLAVHRLAAGVPGGQAVEAVVAQLSREGADDLPDGRSNAVLWNQIGDAHRRNGRPVEAANAHKRAIESSLAAGDRQGQTIGRQLLAKAEAVLDPDAAARTLRKDLDAPGLDKVGEANIRHRLGVLLSKAGRFVDAERELAECLTVEEGLAKESGNDARIAYPLHALGHLYMRQRRPDEAVGVLTRAVGLEKKSGDRAAVAKVLLTLAKARLAGGQRELAVKDIRDSIDLHADATHRSQALDTWAQVLDAEGDREGAVAKRAESMTIAATESGLLRQLVRTRVRAALADRDAGRLADAEKALREVAEVARQNDLFDEHLLAVRKRCRLLAADRPDDAIDALAAAYDIGVANAKRLEQRSLAAVFSDLATQTARRPTPDGTPDRLTDRLAALLGPPGAAVPELAVRFPALWHTAIRACADRLAAGRPTPGQPATVREFLDVQCLRLLEARQFDVLSWAAGDRAAAVGRADGPLAEADRLAEDVTAMKAAKADRSALFWVVYRRAKVLARIGAADALSVCKSAQRMAMRLHRQKKGSQPLYLSRTLRGQLDSARWYKSAAKLILVAADPAAGIRLAALWRWADRGAAVAFLKQLAGRMVARGNRQTAAEVVVVWARALAEWGREWSAGQELRKALEAVGLSDDAQGRLYFAQGELLARQSRPEEAGERFDSAAKCYARAGLAGRQFDALRAHAVLTPRHADGREEARQLVRAAAAVVAATAGHERVRLSTRLAALHRRLWLDAREAEAAAEQAVREADALGDPRLKASARVTRAAVRTAIGQSAGACDDLREAVRLTADDPAGDTARIARRTLGRRLYQSDRRVPEAIGVLSQFVGDAERYRFPADETLDARIALARALRSAGLLAPAVEQLDAAYAAVPTAFSRATVEQADAARRAIRTERAFVRLAAGDPTTALRELVGLAQVWAWTGTRVPADNLKWQARALAELGQPAEARGRLAEAAPDVTANPRTATVYALEATTVELLLGDPTAAAVHLNQAASNTELVQDPAGRQLCRVNVAVRRARIALAQGRWSDAASAAKDAVSADAGLSCYAERLEAFELLATARLREGKLDDAVKATDEALRLEQAGVVAARLGDDEASTHRGAAIRELRIKALKDDHSPKAKRARAEIEVYRVGLDTSGPARPSEADPHEGATPADTAAPADWQPGQEVIGRVVTIRQSGANVVEVELPDGTPAECETGEVFNGLAGDLAKRLAADGWYPFTVLSAEAGKVRLTQRPQYREGIKGWDGKTVVGVVRRHRDAGLVTVELPTGERLDLRFPQEVGWGPDKATAGVDTDGVPLPVRLAVGEDGRLTANARSPRESAIQELVRQKRPVAGVVAKITAKHHFIRLAPGVVAECLRQDTTYGVEYPLLGNVVTGVLSRVVGHVLEMSRKAALDAMFLKHRQSPLSADAMLSRNGEHTWVQLATAVFADVPRGAGPFADGERLRVTLKDRPTRHDRNGLFTLHSAVRAPAGSVDPPFESALPLQEVRADGTLDTPVPPVEPPAARPAAGGRRRFELKEYDTLPLQAFQIEAMEAVDNGDDVLVYAPTGSGKTLVAEWAIEQALRRNKRVVYTSPVKVLSNQKFRDFEKKEWGGNRVGLVTGDEERNPNAPVLVVTTEIFRNWAVERPERLSDMALLVLDELHYLDDPKRGTVWEEAILFAPPHTRLIALSATVPNADELAKWLIAARRPNRVKVIPDGGATLPRPVPLVHHFVGLTRRTQFPAVAADNVDRSVLLAPDQPVNDSHIRSDVRRTIDFLITKLHKARYPLLYFCFQQERCELLAGNLSKYGPDLSGSAEHGDAAVAEFDRLAGVSEASEAEREDLRPFVRRGFAYHHAGLSPAMREVIERLFEGEHLRLMFATDTFAVGVNMSVRTVVFDGLARGNGKDRRPLTGREYAQMSGRAGRMRNNNRPPDEQGDVFAIVREGQVTREHLLGYEGGLVEPINSNFNPSYRTLLNIVCDLGQTPDRVWERTLAARTSGADPGRQARMSGRLKVLERLGYIQAGAGCSGWQFNESADSLPGRICARVGGYELYAAEACRHKWLDDAEPRQLAMWFAAAVFETGIPLTPKARGWADGKLSADWERRLAEVHGEVEKAETEFGVVPLMRKANPTFATLAAAWYDGDSLDEVCRLSISKKQLAAPSPRPHVTRGQLVLTMRVVVQGLAALAAELTPGHLGGPAVREALAVLRRQELMSGSD